TDLVLADSRLSAILADDLSTVPPLMVLVRCVNIRKVVRVDHPFDMSVVSIQRLEVDVYDPELHFRLLFYSYIADLTTSVTSSSESVDPVRAQIPLPKFSCFGISLLPGFISSESDLVSLRSRPLLAFCAIAEHANSHYHDFLLGSS